MCYIYFIYVKRIQILYNRRFSFSFHNYCPTLGRVVKQFQTFARKPRKYFNQLLFIYIHIYIFFFNSHLKVIKEALLKICLMVEKGALIMQIDQQQQQQQVFASRRSKWFACRSSQSKSWSWSSSWDWAWSRSVPKNWALLISR